MNMSKLGMAELAAYECLCLRPYLDSGRVKTVGIGSTVSDIPNLSQWAWDKEISVEEAVNIYKKGLVKYVNGINKSLKVGVSQALFDALVSITYNIGIGAMSSSTFMKRINAQDTQDRIIEAMGRFRIDNGKVVQGLINRRAKEAHLIRTGDYINRGQVDLVPVIDKKPIYHKGTKIDLLPYLADD